jgi:hypothetical protein
MARIKKMSYDPQVNDYVIWENGKNVSGWVYFKINEYITIESNVWEKDEENYLHCKLHRNDRLLVICYRSNWNELKYVRKRNSIHEEVDLSI